MLRRPMLLNRSTQVESGLGAVSYSWSLIDSTTRRVLAQGAGTDADSALAEFKQELSGVGFSDADITKLLKTL